MLEEVWLDVVGYEGYYKVSNFGNVKSRRRMLNPCALGSKDGYRRVNLCVNGAVKTKRVSTLVLEAFVGPRPDGLVACHGPRGKQDDCIDNLYWDTPRRNGREDRYRDGTMICGTMVNTSVLDEIDVLAIRLWLNKGYSQRKIASKFNVSAQAVSNIKTGKSWAWL